MAADSGKTRSEQAQEYAELAKEAEAAGDHRAAAELYRAAVLMMNGRDPKLTVSRHSSGVRRIDLGETIRDGEANLASTGTEDAASAEAEGASEPDAEKKP